MSSRPLRIAFVGLVASLWVQTASLDAAAVRGAPDLADHQPSDAWISAATRIALVRAQAVNGHAIGADSVDGVVLLHGLVANPAEKTRAVAVASRVPGVQGVRDALRIVPAEDQRSVTISDALLASRVSTELAHDEELWDRNVGVHAAGDGVVILAGDVGTPELHERAVRLASRAEGVRRIVSLVSSADPVRDAELWEASAPTQSIDEPSRLRTALSDKWIETRLKLALLADSELSPTGIDVDAREGVVTLFGSVASEREKGLALEHALATNGVLHVDDDLQLVPPSVAQIVEEVDTSLKREIEKRIAAERLEGAKISVAVSNATVRLEGSVPSHRERMRAILVALSTQGVRDVSDGLEVVSRRG